MNDRELLELAAKAAGMLVKKNTVAVDSDDHLIGIKVRATEREKYHTWNPLTNDGDALRLAVKLGIHLTNSNTDAWASTLGTNAAEPFGADPYAATRLVIVRAAAEIGRKLR